MRTIIFLILFIPRLYCQSNRISSDTLYVIFPKTEILIYHPSNPIKTNYDKTYYSTKKPKIIYFSIKGFDINLYEVIDGDINNKILSLNSQDFLLEKQVIINKNTILIECKSDCTFEKINKK